MDDYLIIKSIFYKLLIMGNFLQQSVLWDGPKTINDGQYILISHDNIDWSQKTMLIWHCKHYYFYNCHSEVVSNG